MKLTTLLAIGTIALWQTVASGATITFNTLADFTNNFTAERDAAKLLHNPTMKAMRTTVAGTSISYYTPGNSAPQDNTFVDGSVSTTFQTSQFNINPSVALFARTDAVTLQGVFGIANMVSATSVRLRLGTGDVGAGNAGYIYDKTLTVAANSVTDTFRLTLDVRNVDVGGDTFAELRLGIYNVSTNSLISSSDWLRVNTANSFTEAGSSGLRVYTTPATIQLSLYDFTVIPEPSTLALSSGLAGIALVRWLARRRSPVAR